MLHEQNNTVQHVIELSIYYIIKPKLFNKWILIQLINYATDWIDGDDIWFYGIVQNLYCEFLLSISFKLYGFKDFEK